MLKSICNKIIITIFTLLELFGFLLVVNELPNFLNTFFATNIFAGTTHLSFVFCVFILGYSLNYFNGIKKDAENKKYELELKIKQLENNKR